MQKMSKGQFTARLITYIIFGIVIPVGFLCWRFKLFEKVSKISISGWGLVAIVVVGVFFIKLLKAIRKGLPFSFFTRVIEGLCKVTVPLLLGTFCVYALQDCMTEVFQFLCVMSISETIAMLFNPLPRWAYENQMIESTKGTRHLLESIGLIKQEK